MVLGLANDENGNRVSGDLGKLISAVRNGEPLRIGWTIEHPTDKSSKVEHFADAKFITILATAPYSLKSSRSLGKRPASKTKQLR